MENYIKYIGMLSLLLISCEPEFENAVDEPDFYTNGEADFSNYVALGNSLTAGYADNALYLSGQINSYPNILAQQFAKVGGGEFTQPLVADNAGGLVLGEQQITSNRLVLSIIEGDTLPRIYTGMQPTTNIANTLTGPFNNMGVPGAKSFHLVAPGYGSLAGLATNPPTANPYFVRFASSPETSVIADAVAQDPTFFSLWIGNNDVLGYATSGGVNDENITNPQVFASVYEELVTALTADDTEGILIGIPEVTSVPFFTYIPFAPLDPTNPDFAAQIPTLNQTFSQLNQAFALLGVPGRSIEFSTTAASPVVVKDESLPDISQQLTQVLIGAGLDPATATIYGMQYGQARQATAEDLLPLTNSGVIGEVNVSRMEALVGMGVPQQLAGQLSVNGITYPLDDQYVLIPEEQEKIKIAQTAYNQTIQTLAEANNLAFLDAEAFLAEVAGDGIAFDAGVVTSDFVTGGVFSLDGIHLTPRGYALVANKIIEEINATYNASVPKVNIGNYATITPSNEVN